MKKHLLLSILGLLGFITAIGQTPYQKQFIRLNQVEEVMPDPLEDYGIMHSETNPYVSSLRAPDLVIGNTRYDLQSNYAMQQRMFLYPDGTIGATWTRGTDDPNFTDRGTGYNYYNGTSWGAAPTSRIEAVKTGWPSYSAYGANGEIVISHTANATGLVISKRETKGTGAWETSYLAGPDGLDLLYPRLVTSGEFNETIHVIATTRTTTPYQGLAGAIVYSRSFDGGQTWDPQNLVLEGVDATRFLGFRADCYTFAQPVGETLAFVAGDGYGDVAVMKSIDNGDNWDRIEYYVSIDPFMDGFIEYPRHGALDSYHSIVIDDMGKVHVSSGRQLHRADGLGSRTYYPYSNGLLYWNEDMEPLDTTKIGDNISDPSAVPSQYLLAELVDNGTDTIIGLSTYYSSITSMPQLVFDHEKKILYAIYTSITLGFATELTNFRHVWLRMSDDYGQTWSPPQDLTGDIFHLFSECVYPSASPTVNEKVHFVYQTDNTPGINSRTAEHTVTDNNMVYLTINTIVGMNEKPASVVSIDQISPNPAKDIAQLIVKVDRSVVAEISILNMLGQEVYQSTNAFGYAGPHPIKLDVSNYESGIYFVRVKAGNSSSVKKLIVN